MLDVVHLNSFSFLLLVLDILVEIYGNELKYHVYLLDALIFEFDQIHDILVLEALQSRYLTESGGWEPIGVVVLNDFEILNGEDLNDEEEIYLVSHRVIHLVNLSVGALA